MNVFGNMELFFTKKPTTKDGMVNANDPAAKLFREDTVDRNKQAQFLNSPRPRRPNRKNNFMTRSVWYADEESRDIFDNKSSTLPTTGFTLRKASSLDSLLVEKERKHKLKITKDMISAPIRIQKIIGKWNDIKEKEIDSFSIPEWKEINGSKTSVCETSDSDSVSSSDSASISQTNIDTGTNIQYLGQTITNLDNISDFHKEVIFKSGDDTINEKITIRQKEGSEQNSLLEEDRRKNILFVTFGFNNNHSNSSNETLSVNVVDTENEGVQENAFTTEDDETVKVAKHFTNNILQDVERVDDSNKGEVAIIEQSETEPVFSSITSNESEIKVHSGMKESSDENRPVNVDKTDIKFNVFSLDERKSNSHTIELVRGSKEVNVQSIKPAESVVVEICETNVNLKDENISGGINNSEHVLVKQLHFDKKVTEKGQNFTDRITKRIKKQKKQSGSNLMKMKGLSKSSDVLTGFKDASDAEEVLRTLQSNKDEPLSRSVGPFPKTDDHLFSDGVQLRAHKTDGVRQSQTVGCDPRRLYRNQDFDVKGCVKIQLISDQKEVKLKKNEYIQYINNKIVRNDNEVIKYGVILRSIKLVNKKEVELKDINNQIYLLVFDSSKDAKLFIENEKVSCYTDTEKSTITKTLLRLLGKRSSREVLEKKGIYQNEPIFGNTLRNIYSTEHGLPKFILKTMELIEKPDNITSLGLYRTSGNLATIQKIRLEVDKGNLDILDNYSKDPDVLTGSLKLFFRELKEPLLSCKTCDNLLGFTKNDMNYVKKDRDNIRTILTHIPEANSETLLALIRHLIKVVEYKEQNKMDTYNLAVCWGPTIIFATDSAVTKDLVTQSAEATKLFDALLNFYINNPEELELRKKRHDVFDTNRNMIHRQDSKDSIQSSDSGHSIKNKSSSNLSLDAIDEVLKKSIELIESRLSTEGLYKKNGSTEKVNKILKKMIKRKLADLEKYKNDVYDLSDALKKYLKEGCDSLVTKETVEHVNKICDNTQWLEHNIRQRVITVVMDIPKKDTLIFLVRHLMKLIKFESSHNVPKSEMILIWSRVLNDQMRIIESEEKMTNFLRILLDVFDETKNDITVMHKGMPNGLLTDLKNLQKEKDRISKYDNVPDETDFNSKEATILEEKTEDIEHTKL